jgi:hypothetical protein
VKRHQVQAPLPRPLDRKSFMKGNGAGGAVRRGALDEWTSQRLAGALRVRPEMLPELGFLRFGKIRFDQLRLFPLEGVLDFVQRHLGRQQEQR